jgi:hypothetical protein
MLIPLGSNCIVSWLNKSIGIDQPTTPFEWFNCFQLSYITEVMKIIDSSDGIDFSLIHYRPEISKKDRYTYLLSRDKKIFSYHYRASNFANIFPRRYSCMMQEITTSENLYFVRINTSFLRSNAQEINEFIDFIQQINPNAAINFLLIDIGEKKNVSVDRHNVQFCYATFTKSLFTGGISQEGICENHELQKIYIEMLEKIGYINK